MVLFTEGRRVFGQSWKRIRLSHLLKRILDLILPIGVLST